MFHSGDRVIVLTTYGELPGKIISIDGPLYGFHVGAGWPAPRKRMRRVDRDAEPE